MSRTAISTLAVVLVATFAVCSGQAPATQAPGETQSEKSVNSMIHHCWMLAYTYDAMAAYFGRPEVGQKFMEEFLHEKADYHLARAREMEEHLNLIGGTVKHMEIKISPNTKTTNLEVKESIEIILTMELAARDMLKDLIEKEAESETGHFLGKYLHQDSHTIASLRTLKARADLLKSADLFYFVKILKKGFKGTHPAHLGEDAESDGQATGHSHHHH